MRLIVARCEVTYAGRLTTRLPEAVRLLMIKSDGTFMVWSDGGGSQVKPLNCTGQPPLGRRTAPRSSLVVSEKLRRVQGEEWDWSQHVVDHLDLHASDYGASVEFYTTILAPLGIPSWSDDSEGERATCFARVNVVDRRPPTCDMHLCFVARSREQVDAFHRAGVEAGFRSNGAPGYRGYAPGYYAAFLLDPDR